ncbi:DUF943 family protein [Pseudomonas graminis]
MKVNKKSYAFFFVCCALSGYFFWLSLRPVEIVAAHHRSSSFSDVIVRNFPFTDKGKIAWWLNNKEMLKEKYNVPNPNPDGSFYLNFWLFGDGYKELSKYDRLCFEDMNTKKNCIEKDIVFTVSYSKNMGTMFEAYDGTYRLQKNGEIVKYVSHSEAW